MNNNDIALELEQLKSQMNILRGKLDHQQIVNEQLLRKSMNSKMGWIKKYVWFEIIILPFLLLFFFGMHAAWGLSWWLFGYLAVIMIADVYMDWRINRYSTAELLQGNMVDAARRFTRMKRQRLIGFVVSLPAVIVWVVWLIWEMATRAMAADTPVNVAGPLWGGIVGGTVGAFVGFGVGIYIFRKMQRTNDAILDQINELRAMDEEN